MIKPMAQTVDPITFEILSHRLHQITKEIGITLEHVGGTVNTTQLKDYLAALYLPDGDVLSVGQAMMGMHAVCAGFAVKRIIEQFGSDIYPDDMFLLNDPYLAAIHQSDMYVVSPVHYEEELVGWSATFVHVMDIGAMSPGGNSPGATEICHEGLRIPGIKLVERGKLRNDVFNTMVNMTRQPVMVGLDLKCEIAANNVAKSRIQAVVRQYGIELIRAVSIEMIRYAESVLRKRITEIPDGSWGDTAWIQAADVWKVKLTLHKKGDNLVFDFTGSDKQASTGINLPYHATFGCCFAELLATIGYDIPRNHGAFNPIRVIAPEGSVVNVQNPAPVSLNTTSGAQAVKYLAASVLAQAVATTDKWKHEVMAATLMGRFARHAGISQHGKYYVSTLLESGGSGATSYKDGMNSSASGSIGMICHNVEWVELNFPVVYLFRRHLTDSTGAGKYRGGAGTEVALTTHNAPEGKIKVVALGVAGLRNSGQGIFGGYPGAPSLLVYVEDTRVNEFIQNDVSPVDKAAWGGKARPMAYTEFELKNNDVFYMNTASGGGFGDPLEREPQLLWNDLRNGLVSQESARHIYGVIVEGQGIDAAASRDLRAQLVGERLRGMKTAEPLSKAAVSESRTAGVRRPLREYLEVVSHNSKARVQCVKCSYMLSQHEDSWREGCGVRQLPPTEAGPLMNDLVGHFLLEQLFCPSCGVLLDTRLVENPK